MVEERRINVPLLSDIVVCEFNASGRRVFNPGHWNGYQLFKDHEEVLIALGRKKWSSDGGYFIEEITGWVDYTDCLRAGFAKDGSRIYVRPHLKVMVPLARKIAEAVEKDRRLDYPVRLMI